MAAFQSAPTIAYGAAATVSAPAGGVGVVRFLGKKNQSVIVSSADLDEWRTPRTFLVEKRSNGTYAVVAGSPLTAGEQLAFRLKETHEYFVVVRDAQSHGGDFRVAVDYDHLCTGTPRTYSAAELATRIEQGRPSLTLEGRIDFPNRPSTFATHIPAGETVVRFGEGAVMHDITVDLATGAVTADTPAIADAALVEITDSCFGIDSPAFRLTVDIPKASSRTPLTPVSSPFYCEAEPTITDDLVILDRFGVGASSVAASTQSMLWTEWRCSSATGCIEREGREDTERLGGWLGVDATTQAFAMSIRHVKNNQPSNATVPVTDGTFSWNGYTGRLTEHYIALTKTVRDGETRNGVKSSFEYRSAYCLTW